MKDGINFLAGMILGTVIGAVTALLLTPQSGAELRANIQEQAMEERQRLQSIYERQVAELQPRLDKLQKDVHSVLNNTTKIAESEEVSGEATT